MGPASVRRAYGLMSGIGRGPARKTRLMHAGRIEVSSEKMWSERLETRVLHMLAEFDRRRRATRTASTPIAAVFGGR